eukprot:TRINITY_DN9821_c0_g1_i1.p1 TRINITY_DN9821_c0_g1~~TRINITY_DN9821_c0_g1_i1.p1  ORF type:complete len:148 (+),score=44.28 TRINITY_DN9821_c0_g1_i1:271-714(+)
MTYDLPEFVSRGKVMGKEMARRNRQVLLKCVVQFTGDPCLSIADSNGEVEVKDNSHIMVFETQLKEPQVKSVVHPDYLSWLKEYKIEREKWLLVDVDNYMKGNSYLKRIVSKERKDEVKREERKEVVITEDIIDEFLNEINKAKRAS